MTPAQHWAAAVAKFSPEIRAIARAAVARVRKRMPGAVEFIYDNFNALVIGFGATERPSEAILSIVLYPKRVNLGFIEGAHVPDPAGLLRGSGTQFRHLRLERPSTIGEP